MIVDMAKLIWETTSIGNDDLGGSRGLRAIELISCQQDKVRGAHRGKEYERVHGATHACQELRTLSAPYF